MKVTLLVFLVILFGGKISIAHVIINYQELMSQDNWIFIFRKYYSI
jgi:hypothetical protein